MNNPKNQEHFEALQQTANNIKEEEISKLYEEEAVKFKAVEDAVKILVDNKIYFYLFPFLHSPKLNKKVMWQYNSILKFAQFNESGIPTKESNKLTSIINSSMMSMIFNLVTDYQTDFDKIEPEKRFDARWKCFSEVLYQNLRENYNYMNDIEVKEENEN